MCGTGTVLKLLCAFARVIAGPRISPEIAIASKHIGAVSGFIFLFLLIDLVALLIKLLGEGASQNRYREVGRHSFSLQSRNSSTKRRSSQDAELCICLAVRQVLFSRHVGCSAARSSYFPSRSTAFNGKSQWASRISKRCCSSRA